jgi:hypothetical protein
VAASLAALGLLMAAEAALAISLRPGESAVVSQTVAVPALPPKLDFLLLMDTTGSMGGEISSAQSGGSFFFDEVRGDSPDSAFAVASFEDYPYSTYGTLMAGDQPYRRLTDLVAGRPQWQTALNGLATRNGNDLPEAQVPALFAAVTGQSLGWPGGSTPAGQGISFRSGAARFIALVSDAPFHNDKGSADAYSFASPTSAEALGQLSAAGVRVIAAESNDGAIGADMSAIAADTDGAYTWLNSTGVSLWTGAGVPSSPGILGALRAARYSVTAAGRCGPLDVAISPGSWADVAAESELAHTQTITVPAGIEPSQLPPGNRVDCAVSYTWGDVSIGTRSVEVEVVFPAGPGPEPPSNEPPSNEPPSNEPPSNAFSIDRLRSSSRGTAVLVLDLPGAGTLDILATANAPSRPHEAKRFRVARVSKAVVAGGTARLTLRPSRRARRILTQMRRLRVSLRIAFKPTGGSTRIQTKGVTLKLRRPRR